MSRVNLVTYCALEVVELADQTDTTGAENFLGGCCPSTATLFV